eukprot:SM000327S12488  [mRNA]  locus=s327:8494:9431:- [translate_table: standard]
MTAAVPNLTMGIAGPHLIQQHEVEVPGHREEPAGGGGGGGGGPREGFDRAVEGVEGFLGRSFGGPLWWAVLLLSLAAFGGGYAYLLVTEAGDIPILNGPLR